VLAPSPNLPVPSHTRAIVLLAVAGFASQAMVRVADSILPQIASDLGVTIGAASTIVSAYAIMHGSMQLVIGPLGDRFGKYLTVAIACGVSSILVLLCGFAQSLSGLTLARLASGAAAAWIILGMQWDFGLGIWEQQSNGTSRAGRELITPYGSRFCSMTVDRGLRPVASLSSPSACLRRRLR